MTVIRKKVCGTVFAMWTPDGRECPTCLHKDTDPDPVCPHIFPGRKWFYPIKKELQLHEGRFCFYCVKSHAAQWKHQTKLALKDMPAHFKVHAADDKKCKSQVAWLEDRLKDTQNLGGRVPWHMFEKVYASASLST